MNYRNVCLLLFIFSIIILCIYNCLNVKEGFTDSFEKSEEDYYKARNQGNIPGIPEADSFFKYDNANRTLERYDPFDTSGDGNYLPVDNAVKQCKNMKSCDELDNSDCGYCFYNNKFYYGDETGPKTDVCPGGWVKTKEQCVERRERAICDKVTSCHEMTGDAAICAWCPTINKAFVYKSENGIIVPKYSKDKCDDIDEVTGENLGLVLQKECSAFNQQHPCVGPNEDTGPHSQECLNHLWKAGGCPSTGQAAPQNDANGRKWWNQRSWKAVFEDMKLWFSDANSSDWNLAKSHHKGCYGTDPDPCDPKYGGTLECYQQEFIKNGCKKEGTAYPNSKPDYSISEWNRLVEQYRTFANDANISFDERNSNYKNCYGKALAGATLDTQDNPSDYIFYGPSVGPGGNKQIPVKKILKEGDTLVFMIADEIYTKIIKTNKNLTPQNGFYYVGSISEYGSKSLIPMATGNYNVKKIPSIKCISNFVIYGSWINPNINVTQPVNKVLIEDDKYVFLSQQGVDVKIVKTDHQLGNQNGFYFEGKISEYGQKPLKAVPKGGYNIKLK